MECCLLGRQRNVYKIKVPRRCRVFNGDFSYIVFRRQVNAWYSVLASSWWWLLPLLLPVSELSSRRVTVQLNHHESIIIGDDMSKAEHCTFIIYSCGPHWAVRSQCYQLKLENTVHILGRLFGLSFSFLAFFVSFSFIYFSELSPLNLNKGFWKCCNLLQLCNSVRRRFWR